MISWMIQQTRKEGEDVFSINPVVGECNDSRINEICNRVVGGKRVVSCTGAGGYRLCGR